jgi:hypothetical protein
VSIDNAKLFYVLSCILLAFIILSPTLLAVVPFPEGEKFSELWLLGSNHMIENEGFVVSTNTSNSVYLGVANNMGSFEFYTVYVKLGSSSDPLPNRAAGLPSPLQPIFEYNLFLKNDEKSEREVVFSFENVAFEGDICRISRLSIDDRDVSVDKIVVRDELSGGFYCQLIFELWIYNATTFDFQFHNRAVWFWLNLNRSI